MTRMPVVAVCCLLLGAAHAALGQVYQWSNLSQADALAAVRAFEGSSQLNPTFLGRFTAPIRTLDDFPGSQPYEFQTDEYRYAVSAYTANRFTRRDRAFTDDRDSFYGRPYDAAALAGSAMTADQALAIANAYMTAHYPAPSQLVLSTTTADLAETDASGAARFTESYTMLYGQRTGSADGPSYCRVTVDSVLGRVVAYAQDYYPVLVSAAPTISGDQAISAAMSAALMGPGTPGQVECLWISAPDALGVEALYYTVDFTGTADGDTDPRLYGATVDAQTGDVLEWHPLGGTGTHAGTRPAEPSSASGAGRDPELRVLLRGKQLVLCRPARLVVGRPYLYAGYLCYDLPGARLRYGGAHDIRVEGPGRDVHLSVSRAACRVNGKGVSLPAKPVILRGRCYVPLEVAQAVLPLKARYDAQTRTVYLDPAPRAAP